MWTAVYGYIKSRENRLSIKGFLSSLHNKHCQDKQANWETSVTSEHTSFMGI